MSETWGVGYFASGARGATGRNLSAGERESVMYRLRESFEREERPMSDALETLAMVIQGADEYTEHVGDGSWSERIAEAVLAYLTSDEAVLSAASAMADLSSDRPEASWADLWLAGVAALGVESLPLDPEPWHAPDPVTTRNRVMRCDTCGKFRTAADMERRPVTQEDYLFGDPGPYFDCATCVNGRKGNG